MNIQTQYHRLIGITCLAATIVLFTTQLYASNDMHSSRHQLQNTEITQRASTGKFFGYDQETRKIWINDFVYLLSVDYRVIGTSTKLGLLSAIKYQEVVTFKTAPNPQRPSVPYIIEIRRK